MLGLYGPWQNRLQVSATRRLPRGDGSKSLPAICRANGVSGMIPYLLIGTAIVFGRVFHRIAEEQGRMGLLWMALSLASGILAHTALRWGWTGFFAAQIGLYSVLRAAGKGEASKSTPNR